MSIWELTKYTPEPVIPKSCLADFYEILEMLEDDWVIKWQFWGSREICDPPPTNTDLDMLVLCQPDQFGNFQHQLSDFGWKMGGSIWKKKGEKHHYGTDWASWKKGIYNITLTMAPDFFSYNSEANAYCKRLNVLKKKDRCDMFLLARRQGFIGP